MDCDITETIAYPAVKHDLLKMLLPDLQLSLPKCSLKIVAEGMEIKGTSQRVKQARLDISENVFSFKSLPIPLVDSQRVRLLQSDKSQQQVKELFSKAGIQAVLSVRDNKLWLTGTDDHQNSQASRMLERNICRSEIAVEDFQQEFLHSAHCKQFIEDLERNYSVAVEKGLSSVFIDALGDCSEEVQKQVHDKLEDNAQHSDDVHLTKEEWQLLKTHHQTEVEALGRRSAGNRSVQVALKMAPNGKGVIQVSGDAKLLQVVKTDLKTFVQRIVHKTVTYNIPGLSTHMSEDSLVLNGIQSTCKSVIRVTSDDAEEEDGEMEEELEAMSAAENNNEHETASRGSSVVLEVKQGDLTTFKADVLVNTPAGRSQDLAMCGQVCKAFCNVGGPRMQKSYEAAVNARDNVTVTRASGNLKCRHVFHMRIHTLRGDTYQQLEDQIYRCLQKASELKAKSIIFPTIGCGKLGYNPKEVALCFEHAIKRHDSDDSCCISKVTVAAYEDEAYQQFEELLSVPDSTPPSTGLRKDSSRKQPQRRSVWSHIKGRLFRNSGSKARPSQTTTKGRRSLPNHSGTTFHVTALNQSHIDHTVRTIEESSKAYSAEETVPAQFLRKFTKQQFADIRSLGSEDVSISIDTRAKCIRVAGAKQSVGKTAAAVAQKVHVIEERPEFVRQTRGQNAYLEDISKGQVVIPRHWKSVKNLSDVNAVRVPVDPAVAKSIEDIVQQTWQQHLAQQGRDAVGLSHTTIQVTNVEQIENSHLYMNYEHTRMVFCTHAAKGTNKNPSYPKVTSYHNERHVLTSTLGIIELDDQLIPDINEYFLFHGAPQQNIESILRQGIDFRLNTRGMFGKGAYFGESSTKADQYADDRNNRTLGPHSMFLCKVILGHSHIAKAPANDLQRPPCLHHCTCVCGPSDFHNSVMGTHRDSGHRLLFREFVIYEQSQVYPAYIITYKRK